MSDAFTAVVASLAAAISLLERGGKKAAPSDRMFDQMLADYRNALEDGKEAIARLDARADGWLYHCPDTGTEWSPNHPVESGEVVDAEDVRAATATVLREELLSAWVALAAAEKQAKRQPDALAGSGAGDGALREALKPFAEIADLYDGAEDDDFEVWKDIGSMRMIRTVSELRHFRRARTALRRREDETGSNGGGK